MLLIPLDNGHIILSDCAVAWGVCLGATDSEILAVGAATWDLLPLTEGHIEKPQRDGGRDMISCNVSR